MGCQTHPDSRDMPKIQLNQITKRGFAPCAIIDKVTLDHVALRLSRPRSCISSCTERCDLDGPTFATDLRLPPVGAFFAYRRHGHTRFFQVRQICTEKDSRRSSLNARLVLGAVFLGRNWRARHDSNVRPLAAGAPRPSLPGKSAKSLSP
jgi:hypothetical protein